MSTLLEINRRSINRWLARAAPLDRAGWNLAAGIRAAFAVAVPVVLAESLDMPTLSWAGIVAFWGCMVDQGGAWQDRFIALSGFTVLATLAVVIGLAAEPSPVLSVIVTLIWCFGGGMLRIYGATASSVGLLLVSDMLVTLGIPGMTQEAIILRPVLTLCGGLWAMLLVLVIWRLYPLSPGRRSVAQCWTSISGYAEAIARLHEPHGNASPEAWAELVRSHRSRTREVLETARKVIASLRRGRGGESRRLHQLMDLLADADQTFERIIALSTLLELETSAGEPIQRALMVVLHRLGRQAKSVSASILDQKFKRVRPPTRTVTVLRRLLAVADEEVAILQRAVPLIEEIATLLAGAEEEASGVRSPQNLGAAMTQPGQKISLATIWLPFRANLNRDSVFLRHAARLAVTAAVAEISVRILELPRGYWVTITAAVILQPFMALTWRRSIERVIGSVIGGVLAAGIGLALHRPIEIAIAVFPMAALTMAIRSVNYALFVFCLTPTFVLIAELFQGGAPNDWGLAALRALDSTYGGLLALIASFLLWPSWEGPHLASRIAGAVRGSRGFFLAALADRADPDELQAARRQAGLSSNNAEASLQRLMGEPHRELPAEAEPAMMMVASLRRLGGIATVIGITGTDNMTPTFCNLRQEFKAWINRALEAIAIAVGRHDNAVELASSPATRLDQRELTADEQLILREFDLAKAQILILAAGVERLATASRG